MTDNALPAALAEISEDFLDLDENSRLELLLDFSRELPALPERYSDHPEELERVAECQSPVFIRVELDADQRVQMFATAPQEAPTTRGFASILVQGLSGLSIEEALAVPSDYSQRLGLARAVSPLRLAGMTGMIRRAQRQIRVLAGHE
ncbi:SufE family protein [Mycetocola tolaasinivorans]|uniref:SufE family protein n=1 Tax=Mycetocola tolaasinivorans TaxID=76635 RepID=A0A3L7AAX7_9MICO|nr:SufE family protein [Mycetocola tolaasinivorans]RLP76978.1 SufE family protein [Mycetocola tolaasinivorans]